MRTATDIRNTLDQLLALPAETETVEFKEANEGFDFSKLGKYFSALSNEANLAEEPCAWLVFGVSDKRKVVGTQYRRNRPHLDSLKKEIADKITNRITFLEIYEVDDPAGRVLLFQIPAAPPGIPVGFEGHYYGRDGESLVALNIQELDRIRAKSIQTDWSAGIVPDASLADLHPDALKKARLEFKKKNPSIPPDEVDVWDDMVFLNKAKLTINGQLTRTTLILLGRPESVVLLSPQVAQVIWLLKKEDNSPLDYQHFSPPFLLEVDRVLSKIRNLRYRYLPAGTLFPEELDMYDGYVIREALHNCLAHQDYTLQERVVLVEFPEHLLFENGGSFIPGTIERVIEQNAPQRFYRNKFLAEAMVTLDMIDTMGNGIRKMFVKQRERFFPMPDYDLTEPQTVRLRLEGRILDKNYTQLLRDRQLTLETVIWLDKVQKRKTNLLTDKQIETLKLAKLIEGRKPNYYVSFSVARQIGQEDDYLRNRTLTDEQYREIVTNYLKDKGFATRLDIENLLEDQLSDLLTPKQKHTKISNLLTALRVGGVITNVGADRKPKWTLAAN